MIFLVLSVILIPLSEASMHKEGAFYGRIVKYSPEAKLLKVRVNFDNIKYLNKTNTLKFWKTEIPSFKCQGLLLGKSSYYLLVKISKHEECSQKVPLGRGYYLRFYSPELVKNIKTGQELIKILLKKRIGIKGQLERAEQRIKSHVEKLEVVNQRYEVLRKKLEHEWRDEL